MKTKDYLALLTELAGIERPNAEPSPRDWSLLEAQLNITFPATYKAFVQHFGGGCFGDALWVLEPEAEHANLRLNRSFLRKRASDMRHHFEDLPARFQIFTTTRGFLPVVLTDAQVDFALLVEDNQVADAVTMINWALREVIPTGFGLAECVYRTHEDTLPGIQLRQTVWGAPGSEAPFFSP